MKDFIFIIFVTIISIQFGMTQSKSYKFLYPNGTSISLILILKYHDNSTSKFNYPQENNGRGINRSSDGTITVDFSIIKTINIYKIYDNSHLPPRGFPISRNSSLYNTLNINFTLNNNRTNYGYFYGNIVIYYNSFIKFFYSDRKFSFEDGCLNEIENFQNANQVEIDRIKPMVRNILNQCESPSLLDRIRYLKKNCGSFSMINLPDNTNEENFESRNFYLIFNPDVKATLGDEELFCILAHEVGHLIHFDQYTEQNARLELDADFFAGKMLYLVKKIYDRQRIRDIADKIYTTFNNNIPDSLRNFYPTKQERIQKLIEGWEDPQSPYNRAIIEAKNSIRNRKFIEALKYLDSANQSQYHDKSEIYLLKGNCYYELRSDNTPNNDYKSLGIASFIEYFRLIHPGNNEKARFELGHLYYISLSYENAVSHLERSIINNKSNFYAFFYIGDAYKKLNNSDSASHYFLKITNKIDKNNQSNRDILFNTYNALAELSTDLLTKLAYYNEANKFGNAISKFDSIANTIINNNQNSCNNSDLLKAFEIVRTEQHKIILLFLLTRCSLLENDIVSTKSFLDKINNINHSLSTSSYKYIFYNLETQKAFNTNISNYKSIKDSVSNKNDFEDIFIRFVTRIRLYEQEGHIIGTGSIRKKRKDYVSTLISDKNSLQNTIYFDYVNGLFEEKRPMFVEHRVIDR